MPVQLPLQPAGISLPAPPQDPPTLADVVAAKFYQRLVDVAVASQTLDGPTADDAARADVYQANVIMAHSAMAAAPPWFHPAMTAILAPINIILAKTQNHQLLDGRFTPFTIVPFKDGSMPPMSFLSLYSGNYLRIGHAWHNLPPLVNVAAVRAAAQSTTYAAGYALGNIKTARERRVAIGRAIGCTVVI